MWRKLLIATTLLSLASCHKDDKIYSLPKFTVEQSIRGEIINNDVVMNNALDICCTDKYLVALSLVDGKWLQLYDKNTGQFIASIIGNGQGPNELIYPTCICYENNDNVISISDMAKQKLMKFTIDESLVPQKKQEIDFSNTISSFYNGFSLPEDHFLIESRATNESESLLSVFDSSLTEISKGGEYPKDPVMIAAMWSNTHADVSPDGKHYAIGTIFGGILNTYEITETAIKCLYEGLLIEPKGEINGYSFTPTETTILGFCDLMATNQCLYGIFLGSSEEKETYITKWGWNGQPMARYQTGKMVLHVCCDISEENVIFAFSLDENGHFIFEKYHL